MFSRDDWFPLTPASPRVCFDPGPWLCFLPFCPRCFFSLSQYPGPPSPCTVTRRDFVSFSQYFSHLLPPPREISFRSRNTLHPFHPSPPPGEISFRSRNTFHPFHSSPLPPFSLRPLPDHPQSSSAQVTPASWPTDHRTISYSSPSSSPPYDVLAIALGDSTTDPTLL
ncbi:unnamed protein product [Ectocarpus sp. 4 AP-2014]